MIGHLEGPWFALAALLLLAAPLRHEARPRRSTVFLLLGLTAGGLAARLWFGVWGPLHINGQGPLWVRGALEADALVGYGPGYYELFGWLARRAARPDRALFAANAILSSLCPALLYAVARLAGAGRAGAGAAAAALAADGVLARSAASEGYFAALAALLLAVQAALVVSLRADERGERAASGLGLLAAGLFAAAAARIHPMAYLPLAIAPLVLAGAARPREWSARLGFAITAGAACAAAVLLTSGQAVVSVVSGSAAAAGALAHAGAEHAVLAGALLLALVPLRRRLDPPWLPAVGIASLCALAATRGGFLQHPLWTLCYERLFWPGILLGAASLLPHRWPAAAGLAAGVAAAAAALLPAWPQLRARNTEQLEYAFLAEVLPTAPPGCRLAVLSRVGSRIWSIPDYLLAGAAGGGAVGVESAADLQRAARAECVVYVRSSLCSSVEARERCERIEREVPLEPLAARSFPAVPSFVSLPYDRGEVEVAVFRVRAAEGD